MAFLKQKVKITRVTKETLDTATITMKGDAPFDFKPGQFVMVQLLGKETVPKRAYSISSSPTRNETLEITVKQMPDGWVSKLLNGVRAGDEMMVDGPYGHFVFDPEKMKSIVLLAAGSGIAPFRCFCQYIEDKKLGTKVHFVYSSKTEEDIIFRDTLKGFAKRNKNLSLLLTLTREEKEGYHSGRIDEEMVKDITKKNPGAFYFICGPPKMVAGTKALLEAAGIPKEGIKVEIYG
ncbi:MAG: FAD-binding oxidoreductase [archaeon]|nr:FAD-binding oxidoreductase [archaeon]